MTDRSVHHVCEAAILAALRAGATTVDAIVARVYVDVADELHPVARRSVHAHLLKLVAEDYNEQGLQELLSARGSAYDLNIEVFKSMQNTISGWPGGDWKAERWESRTSSSFATARRATRSSRTSTGAATPRRSQLGLSDMAGVLLFRRLLSRARAAGTTIVLNSHQLDQVERVCERVAFMKHGRIESIEVRAPLTGQDHRLFL